MKGIIFNHFESFVGETFGEDFFEDVLDSTELATAEPFVGPGTYPDADLIALVTKTVERAQLQLADALEAFGRYLFPRLAAGHSRFLEGHDLKSFMRTVESVIHVEVKKLYPGAETPSFAYEDPGPGRLVVRYSSARKLCSLFRGLLAGAAEHFGEAVEIRELRCLLDDAECCEFHLSFTASAHADER